MTYVLIYLEFIDVVGKRNILSEKRNFLAARDFYLKWENAQKMFTADNGILPSNSD